MKMIAVNKRAKFDYDILEKFEAGIVLTGAEVKSVKLGNISLKGSYMTINPTGPQKQPEAWLINAHISPYKPAGPQPDYDPEKSRKLLLHKKEIDYLIGKQREGGLTIIPLSVYTKKARIKVEIGLGRGKKKFEKRERIKKREAERKIQRALRERS
jgi:SsrA-binding protein